MATALRVVAGALAAGPAGVIWAFRKSQQEGELAPNSTLASLAPQGPRCVANDCEPNFYFTRTWKNVLISPG